MEDFIATNQLEVRNIGKVPTFIGRGTSTVIDVTLTFGAVKIQNWKVNEDRPIISDHRLITFELETYGLRDKEAETAIDYKHINWHAFRSFLD